MRSTAHRRLHTCTTLQASTASCQCKEAHHLLRVRQLRIALEVEVADGARHVERAVDAVVAHKAAGLREGSRGGRKRASGRATLFPSSCFSFHFSSQDASWVEGDRACPLSAHLVAIQWSDCADRGMLVVAFTGRAGTVEGTHNIGPP